MSDEFIPPNPENPEPLNFDLGSLNAEPVDMPGEIPTFEPPKKARWWDSWRSNKKSPGAPNASKPRKMRKPAPAMPRGGLAKPLTDIYVSLGMVMMPFDPSCAKIIIEQAPACAEALDEMAKQNPAVRRILISLVTTSAWGKVIMAHAPILMAVAMHHVPALKNAQEKAFAEMVAGFTASQAPQTEGDE